MLVGRCSGQDSNVGAADSQQVSDFRTTRVHSGTVSTRDLAGPLKGRCPEETTDSATLGSTAQGAA